MNDLITLPDPPAPITKEEILQVLRKYQIPFWTWETRMWTLDDLVNSMTKDRVHFLGPLNGRIVLDVYVVVIIVQHRFNRQRLELHEQRQIFDDGQCIERKMNGIAETIRRDESLETAARRCLSEELGFRDPSRYRLCPIEKVNVERRDIVPSEKWPGMFARYNRYIFTCEITRKIFRRVGYTEPAGRRTVFFHWKPAPECELLF